MWKSRFETSILFLSVALAASGQSFQCSAPEASLPADLPAMSRELFEGMAARAEVVDSFLLDDTECGPTLIVAVGRDRIDINEVQSTITVEYALRRTDAGGTSYFGDGPLELPFEQAWYSLDKPSLSFEQFGPSGIAVSYVEQDGGMCSTVTMTTMEVVSFVRETPRTVSIYCTEVDACGHCGIDAVYGASSSAECRWDPSVHDVVCEVERVLNTGFTVRRAQRHMRLFKPEELPVEPFGYRHYGSVHDFASDMHSSVQRAVIAGVGMPVPVMAYDFGDAGTYRVYAMGATGRSLGLSLLLVGDAGYQWLQSRRIAWVDSTRRWIQQDESWNDVRWEYDFENDQASASYTPVTMVFARVDHLVTRGSVTLVRLIVEDGMGRGVFWLGVDSRDGRPRFEFDTRRLRRSGVQWLWSLESPRRYRHEWTARSSLDSLTSPNLNFSTRRRGRSGLGNRA